MHGHAKALQHVSHCSCNSSEADQANRTVRQLFQASASHVAHLDGHLAAIPHSLVTGNHIFDHAEHQKKRLLSHCLCVHARTVAHINTPRSGRFQIDLVERNTLRMDHPQGRQSLYQPFGNFCDRVHNDHLCVRRQLRICSIRQSNREIHYLRAFREWCLCRIIFYIIFISDMQYLHRYLHFPACLRCLLFQLLPTQPRF